MRLPIISIFFATVALPVDTRAIWAAPVNGTAKTSARIEVQWAGRAVTLFVPNSEAPTIGIWNQRTQIKLREAEAQSIRELFDKSKFDAMPASFGGMPRAGRGPGPERPERLVGSISRTMDGKTKAVAQKAGGAQSVELEALAKGILDLCEPAVKNGVTARDFKDGISKIKKQDLAPQTVSLLVHRIVEGPAANAGDSFLMRVNGTTVTVQKRSEKGYAEPIRLELSPKDLDAVMKLLLDNEAGALPINLYAQHYTDFVASVLGHEKNIQARQFAGMTPQTHGEKQQHFDRILAGMMELYRRVVKEGKPTTPAKPGNP